LLELFSFDFPLFLLGEDYKILASYYVEEWMSSAYLFTALLCFEEDY